MNIRATITQTARDRLTAVDKPLHTASAVIRVIFKFYCVRSSKPPPVYSFIDAHIMNA